MTEELMGKYLDILKGSSNEKPEELVNFLYNHIGDIPNDQFKPLMQDVKNLRDGIATEEELIRDLERKNQQSSPAQSGGTPTPPPSFTEKGRKFFKKHKKKIILAAGALAIGTTWGLSNIQRPQFDQTTDKTTGDYASLDVQEGMNFNPNDLNQLTEAAASLAKELSLGGYVDYYNTQTKEYKPIEAEDALMLIEALNLGNNEYDSWRKAQIYHDASSAARYDEVMNELYTFTVADAMTLTNTEESKINYSKIIANKELSSMVNGLQEDIVAYNNAKPNEKSSKAKALLDKWITSLENRSDLPTNDAFLTIIQAQIYGFVNRLHYDGLSISGVGFDESRFANIFYDLPSCKSVDEDALNAYWHGNIRTENSDVTVTRLDRKVEFEGFFDKVKTHKTEISQGIETKKYTDDAEWDDLIALTNQKMGDFKIVLNPDFTQEKIDAMKLANGDITLKDGETIQYDAKGNAYILKEGTVIDSSSKLPSKEEAEQQIEEEKEEMLETADQYVVIGRNDAHQNGDRTGNNMRVPSGLSEVQKNGYISGYQEGVQHNQIAYQLGLYGQSLTSELSDCTTAYNVGRQEYLKNQEQEEEQDKEQEEIDKVTAEEAYNAGYHAYNQGAGRNDVPEKYQYYSYEWQNGWDNAKLDKEHNIGNITDVPSNGILEPEAPSLPAEEEPSAPVEEPESPVIGDQPSEETPSTPEITYTWMDVYYAAVEAAYAAGVNLTGEAFTGNIPEEYKGLEDAWYAGWDTAILEYELNQPTNQKAL